MNCKNMLIIKILNDKNQKFIKKMNKKFNYLPFFKDNHAKVSKFF